MPDQDTETSDAEVPPRVRSSELTLDKDKDALSTEEDSTDGLDAPGAKTSQEPELSESSERVPKGALSGDQARMRRPSAGAKKLEFLRDSSDLAADAFSGPSPEEDTLDVPEGSSGVELSRDGLEMDKDVSLMLEVTTDGLDADGPVNGPKLELSEDSEGVLLDALPGDSESSPRTSAGTERPDLSEPSERVPTPAESMHQPEEDG